jgi:hypothetical protein
LQGILCRVQTIHVSLVMFGVVKLHDLLRDVWFEGLNAQPDPKCQHRHSPIGQQSG